MIRMVYRVKARKGKNDLYLHSGPFGSHQAADQAVIALLQNGMLEAVIEEEEEEIEEEEGSGPRVSISMALLALTSQAFSDYRDAHGSLNTQTYSMIFSPSPDPDAQSHAISTVLAQVRAQANGIEMGAHDGSTYKDRVKAAKRILEIAGLEP